MTSEPPTGHDGPFIQPDPVRIRRRRRRRRLLWHHAWIHLTVAAIGIGFAVWQGDFDRSESRVREPTKLREVKHESDDPAIRTGSELMRIVRVDGDQVTLRVILGREFTWPVATPALTTKLRAASGDQVIVTWTRDARDRAVVSGVLAE